MNIEERLRASGLALPAVSAPAANYVPYQVSGKLLVVSGQLPMENGKPTFIGRVGRDLTLEEGQEAARLCLLNLLAHVKNACGGDWNRLGRALRLGVFVSATEDFTQHPQVANGASDLLVAAMGENGRHARAAVGVGGLPFGVAVEVEGMFELA